MLHEFLAVHRKDIIAAIREKTVAIAESKPTSPALEKGLSEFYDRLLVVLRSQAEGNGKDAAQSPAHATTRHGRESLRLGYTVSQVVHGYGVICQAITEAAEKKGGAISAAEFGALNLSLDVAIAEAVTGYAAKLAEGAAGGGPDPVVALLHELRNSLTCALLAHGMVTKGVVGIGGTTNAMLERNLQRMQELLDGYAAARQKPKAA